MAIAEIHGKTPYDYYEDILTADVFAAFRYLPADVGIIGFLRSIKALGQRIPVPGKGATCQFHFWPRGELCRREPDVLLELKVDGTIFHLIVEAKYMSGPSDMEDYEAEHDGDAVILGNQLADEYRDLVHGVYTVERGPKGYRRLALASNPGDRFLLYLTAHLMRPDEHLQQARHYLPEMGDHLLWSSWYQIQDYLAGARDQLITFPYHLILHDLYRLLDKKGFSPFGGVSEPQHLDLGSAFGFFWQLFDLSSNVDLSAAAGSFWDKGEQT